MQHDEVRAFTLRSGTRAGPPRACAGVRGHAGLRFVVACCPAPCARTVRSVVCYRVCTRVSVRAVWGACVHARARVRKRVRERVRVFVRMCAYVPVW